VLTFTVFTIGTPVGVEMSFPLPNEEQLS